jgi:hypothetical protein
MLACAGQGGAKQVNEVGPSLRTTVPFARTVLPSPPLGGFGFRFWFGERLRIIAVPHGGSSWRRDRPLASNGRTTAKAAGIESRRVRGDVSTAASSELCAGSPRGPPWDVASKTVVIGPVTGGASHPKATGSGPRRMERSRGCSRSDGLSLLPSPHWRSPVHAPVRRSARPTGPGQLVKNFFGSNGSLLRHTWYTARAISAARMPNAFALPHFFSLRCIQHLAGS